MSIIHPREKPDKRLLRDSYQPKGFITRRFQPGNDENRGEGPPKNSRRVTAWLHDILGEPYDPGKADSPTMLEYFSRVLVARAMDGHTACIQAVLERIDPVERDHVLRNAANIVVNMIAENAQVSLPSASGLSPIIDVPAVVDETPKLPIPIEKSND